MEILQKQNKTIVLHSGETKDTLLLFHLLQKEEIPFFLNHYPNQNLVLILGNDWESDFTPYPHQKVFHGGKDFLGNADLYQKELLTEILPTAEEKLEIRPERRIIGGYSLAGLFALILGYCSPSFTDICCCSPSLWYPGYLDTLKTLPIPKHLRHVYLSIGKKESETKNPYLSKARKAVEDTDGYLSQNGIDTHLVIEEGGHFQEANQRQKRGIDYLLSF